MMFYNAHDHYWIVGGDKTAIYASARARFVQAEDVALQAWTARGGTITRIDSEKNLHAVLRAANVPPYHLVPKRKIVDRLAAAGKLDAARAALDAADLYTRERWNTRDAIYSDDKTALALLKAIGADPATILAPE